jgi:hypothetical protein
LSRDCYGSVATKLLNDLEDKIKIQMTFEIGEGQFRVINEKQSAVQTETM